MPSLVVTALVARLVSATDGTAVLAVEDGARCVPAGELVVGGGHPVGGCLVAVTDPVGPIVIGARGETLTLDTRIDWSALAAAVLADGVTVIPAPRPIPVGGATVAAAVVLRRGGRASAGGDLNITATGAELIGLEWIGPGVALVQVRVPRAVEAVAITARGATTTTVAVAVDPGPPAVTVVAPPHARRGEPFALAITVATPGGAPRAPDEVVSLSGCAVVADAAISVTCPGAGTAWFAVRAATAAGVVAIDTIAVEIEAPPAAPRTVARASPPPPPRIPAHRWRAALGIARDGWGDPGVRLAAGVEPRRWAVPLGGTDVGVGVELAIAAARGRYPGAMPIDGELALDRFTVGPAVTAAIGAPVAGLVLGGRLGLGAALRLDRGEVGGRATRSTGLDLEAAVAAEVAIPLDRVAITIALGVRLVVAPVATAWDRSPVVGFAEVGVAR